MGSKKLGFTLIAIPVSIGTVFLKAKILLDIYTWFLLDTIKFETTYSFWLGISAVLGLIMYKKTKTDPEENPLVEIVNITIAYFFVWGTYALIHLVVK